MLEIFRDMWWKYMVQYKNESGYCNIKDTYSAVQKLSYSQELI